MVAPHLVEEMGGNEVSKPKVHVLMVVDKSGSMIPLAGDVAGGFNRYLDDLADTKGVRLTVALFSAPSNPFNAEGDTSGFQYLCTRAKVNDVPLLASENYKPQGFTALNDAIGQVIFDFEESREYDRPRGDSVMMIIFTDGEENHSVKYSDAAIRSSLEQRRKEGWVIEYVGVRPEAWAQGARYGLHTTRASGTSHSTQSGFTNLRGITVALSSGMDPADAIKAYTAAVESADDQAGGK